MVYRHTPLASAIRSYSAGGSRSMIDTIDDAKQMQEPNKTQAMRGESYSAMEAPQNYGFTSVVADADKDKGGMIKDCAEGFMSFMGGNRSFPVMGIMDDRRHRLLNLAKDAAKGATAMFGLKKWGQQFLNTEDGMFMTGNTEKKLRFQLVDNQNDKKQPQQSGGGSSGGAKEARATHFTSKSGVEFAYVPDELVEGFSAPGVVPLAEGGGSNGGGQDGQQSEEQQQAARGQKTLHKEESKIWLEQNKSSTTSAHGDAYSGQRGGQDSSTYYKDRKTSSCQSTADHSHINCGDTHIWVDKGTCYADMPLIIKKDDMCKY